MNKTNKYIPVLSPLLSFFFRASSKSVVSPACLPLSSLQRPSSKNRDAWRVYWKSQGQSWRIEPEIALHRQQELSKRRAIAPDIEKDLYPFKGMKLSRADVEWLLATHENGRGPIDWSDEKQRSREGLDLRGADLRQIDLSNLPLARLRGGPTYNEWQRFSEWPKTRTRIFLERADLRGAHLEGAILHRAHLQESSLSDAYLQKADLGAAHLEHARLFRTNLEGAFLRTAHLEYAHLDGANLQHTDLRKSYFEGTDCSGVILNDEHRIGPQLADVFWGEVNLSVIEWSKLKQLEDEYNAHQKHDKQGVLKSRECRLIEYETAVRANRQLAVVLQNQGLNEDAARFAHRAQILQRNVLLRQRSVGKWFFSLLLALLTGYGYQMWRIVVAYAVVISVFAGAYFALGAYFPPHLSLLQAFLESVTAFHGRVFVEVFASNTPQIWVTASEAVVGLLIEGIFVAMLTQRFFGR